jgi:hypothetical protein
LISPWLEKQVLSDDLDHTSLLRYATDMWGLGALGARTAAAKSFASSWKVAGAVRTDVPVNIPEPTTLPNPVVEGLNPNQLALVGFSRYLETQTMAMAETKGPAAAKAMTMEIGQRVLWSSAEDRHGEVAVERVDRFFELARQSAPARAGAGRAKKKRAEKTPVKAAGKKAALKKESAKKASLKKASLKKESGTRGAAKKVSRASAKEKTVVAERKTSGERGKVNPVLKTAAKGIAKAAAKKALAKAVKKGAKRPR